jgi:hypothetical protein
MFGRSIDTRVERCKQLGKAVNSKDIGELVAVHEQQLLDYYSDVRRQLNASFIVATAIAIIGFLILIRPAVSISEGTQALSDWETITGVLAQFISATVFWLYSRTAKQFGTFHIVLERSCRYLLGYLIADQTGKKKQIHDELLRDLVCIMANAPAINFPDQRPSLPIPGRSRKRGPSSNYVDNGSAPAMAGGSDLSTPTR